MRCVIACMTECYVKIFSGAVGGTMESGLATIFGGIGHLGLCLGVQRGALCGVPEGLCAVPAPYVTCRQSMKRLPCPAVFRCSTVTEKQPKKAPQAPPGAERRGARGPRLQSRKIKSGPQTESRFYTYLGAFTASRTRFSTRFLHPGAPLGCAVAETLQLRPSGSDPRQVGSAFLIFRFVHTYSHTIHTRIWSRSNSEAHRRQERPRSGRTRV